MSTASQSSEPERLTLTSTDLAEQLGISLRYLHTLKQAGKFPAPFRLGRSVRCHRTEIETWLSAGAPPRDQWEAMKATQNHQIDPPVREGRQP